MKFVVQLLSLLGVIGTVLAGRLRSAPHVALSATVQTCLPCNLAQVHPRASALRRDWHTKNYTKSQQVAADALGFLTHYWQDGLDPATPGHSLEEACPGLVSGQLPTQLRSLMQERQRHSERTLFLFHGDSFVHFLFFTFVAQMGLPADLNQRLFQDAEWYKASALLCCADSTDMNTCGATFHREPHELDAQLATSFSTKTKEWKTCVGFYQDYLDLDASRVHAIASLPVVPDVYITDMGGHIHTMGTSYPQRVKSWVEAVRGAWGGGAGAWPVSLARTDRAFPPPVVPQFSYSLTAYNPQWDDSGLGATWNDEVQLQVGRQLPGASIIDVPGLLGIDKYMQPGEWFRQPGGWEKPGPGDWETPRPPACGRYATLDGVHCDYRLYLHMLEVIMHAAFRKVPVCPRKSVGQLSWEKHTRDMGTLLKWQETSGQ